MTSRLYLLRHAKARFATPGMSDFDRPLEPVGTAEAPAVGREMAARSWMPDLVLCSTAPRAQQTWYGCRGELSSVPETKMMDELYRADTPGYLQIIKGSGAETSLMVVGHNPMIEEVTLQLVSPQDHSAEDLRRSGFPTASLTVIEFDNSLAEIQPGSGRLVEILKPERS
ncbi:histidine phosphatase family protein [Tianweitania sp. BSSL-BM11]|uniref:Histidine phosphatase family protein n=1 Tax=Tianweitania aestuarii TaxID=2814886 RepID=A0ABS5RUJ1_9HYPH|nr:histidine phosphatase family protein [Tianweitania aestuarii]MBS9720713.1 histidine phosphatase family protein [Tianweitania aestuarii]